MCRWRTTGCSHGRAAAARQAVCGTCRWVAGCVSPSEQAAKMHAEKLVSAAGRRPPAPGWPPGHSGPPGTASAAPGMGGGADAPALDVRFVLPPQAAGAQLSAAELLLTAPPLQLRVETDAATLSDCSDLCLCPPPPAEGATAALWAPAAVVYASRCRAEVPIGATCANPLPVRRGAHNHATGVHDQFFVYTPAASATHCSVSAAHRGILRSTKRAPA